MTGEVKQGAPIFRLDSSKQEAAAETARRKIAETDAAMVVARTDVLAAEAKIQEARSAHQQAVDELETKQEIYRRNPGAVAVRDIEKLKVTVEGRQGGIDAATATKGSAEAQIASLLPAQKASAEAELSQAEVDLAKTVVRAGVGGRVEQFTLRVGDVVNPFMRPAGVLIPEGAGRQGHHGGLRADRGPGHQGRHGGRSHLRLEALDGDPDGGDAVQDFIAAGQFRAGEQLIDAQQVVRPGTILVFLEPLYEGGLDGVTPGSSCFANAYTSNHDLIASGQVSATKGLVLHAVDAVGLVHAMILRIQALMYPIQTLVLGGH